MTWIDVFWTFSAQNRSGMLCHLILPSKLPGLIYNACQLELASVLIFKPFQTADANKLFTSLATAHDSLCTIRTCLNVNGIYFYCTEKNKTAICQTNLIFNN